VVAAVAVALEGAKTVKRASSAPVGASIAVLGVAVAGEAVVDDPAELV
jgi:hypothetical protein